MNKRPIEDPRTGKGSIVAQKFDAEWHIIATAEHEREVGRGATSRWREHLCIRRADSYNSRRYEIAICKDAGGRLTSTDELRLILTYDGWYDEWFDMLGLLGEARGRIREHIQSDQAS